MAIRKDKTNIEVFKTTVTRMLKTKEFNESHDKQINRALDALEAQT